MIANILIGALIFTYAAWTLYKFVKKSKQGKCASCSDSPNCESSSCCDVDNK